ncbi:hypothetical protein ACIQVR_39615 [Streptomyces xanthochromogenes]|uniref:hypothetical protein n=1 Tax=Streptomyces xanthochromogenes TaxID=67384 RepID=UPI00381735CC
MTTAPQTASAAAATESRDYLWIMTVQSRGRNYSLKGVWPIRPGAAREQVFADIHKFVAEQVHCDDFAINYFSLEPNQL